MRKLLFWMMKWLVNSFFWCWYCVWCANDKNNCVYFWIILLMKWVSSFNVFQIQFIFVYGRLESIILLFFCRILRTTDKNFEEIILELFFFLNWSRKSRANILNKELDRIGKGRSNKKSESFQIFFTKIEKTKNKYVFLKQTFSFFSSCSFSIIKYKFRHKELLQKQKIMIL